VDYQFGDCSKLSFCRFEKLNKGHFPLGFKREGARIPAIKRSEIDAAAQRLIGMEEELKASQVKRRNKKARQEKKKVDKMPISPLTETVDSEDGSSLLNDSVLMDNVDENYNGYIAEPETAVPKRKKSKSTEKAEVREQETETSPQSQSPRKVKRAKRKSTGSISPTAQTPPDPLTTVAESSPGFKNNMQSGTGNGNDGETYVIIKRKRRMSEPRNQAHPKDSTNTPPKKLSTEQVSQIYSSLIASAKRTKLGTPDKLGQIQTPSPKTIGKAPAERLSVSSSSPKPPMTAPSSSSVKKTVNFVLARNLEHRKLFPHFCSSSSGSKVC